MLNPLENCLLLLGLPLAMLLAGYWLVAGLKLSATERLAAGTLAGVCVLIWTLSVVASFRPVAGVWAWLCLWPIACTLARPASRRQWFADLTEVLGSRRGLTGLLIGGALLVFVLWPTLTTPGLVYQDGTSNHDGFLWVSDAEHLKRHTYWEMPFVSPTHPYAYTAGAIVGWQPPWGRIAGEALLALVSSIVGLAPVKIYVVATATLYFPWIAAVYLAVRTFLLDRLSLPAVFALLALQSLFVYYHANANLPNLVGAITGAAVVVATQRCLQTEGDRRAWAVLLALAVHALLCSYPEMWPFVALPAGLLWLRGAVDGWRRRDFPPARMTLLALLGGLALNFATTARAWYAFFGAIFDATHNDRGNLFARLGWPEYPAAMLTISVRASKSLGPVVSGLVALALLFGVVLAWRRARDRFGVIAMLSGAALLGAYTVTTHFSYGWQKTIQFAGPLIAALIPVAALEALAATGATDGLRRRLRTIAFATALLFTSYATVCNGLEWHKWSHLKFITDDWFDLRDHIREREPGRPVLIDSATFTEGFFQGMWATYFLTEVPVYFAARGWENGGYLHRAIASEENVVVPAGTPVLVGREWADTLDANSTRRLSTATVVLLNDANRVTRFEGTSPGSGVPRYATARIALTIRPHSRSRLVLALAPQPDAPAFATRWHANAAVDARTTYAVETPHEASWRFVVPLEAGRDNVLTFHADAAPPSDKLPPFVVRELRIENAAP